jgi:hypothetical protein
MLVHATVPEAGQLGKATILLFDELPDTTFVSESG